MENQESLKWYEQSYKSSGFGAQRKYPNEELCRFIGRRFGQLNIDERKKLKLLEVGSGSGANLWMLAEQNFDVIGIDLSNEGIELSKLMLKNRKSHASLVCGDMCKLENYIEPKTVDLVVDIFSSNCLSEKNFHTYMRQTSKVLKSGGLMFLYTPSKESDAFKNYIPSELIDSSTLNGIRRSSSPFFGNYYPFRFESMESIEKKFKEVGMEIEYRERVSRTYRNGEEYFEFLVIEAVKK